MTDHNCLAEMLELQRKLEMETYGHTDPSKMTDKERTRFIQINMFCLTDEIHEAASEVGWKPWALSNHVNEDAFKSELVDAWHFFMNLLLVARMGPTELHERYMAKNRVNQQRQKEGYDGLAGKCPVCHRDFNDVGVLCTLENHYTGEKP